MTSTTQAIDLLLDRDEQVREDAERFDNDTDVDLAREAIVEVEKTWGHGVGRSQFEYGCGLDGGEDEAHEWGPTKYGAYVLALEDALADARAQWEDQPFPGHIYEEWARDFQGQAGF